jgi:hypothetical protein
MSLQKQNTQKLTVKAARGASNGRHENNRVRGKVFIIIISYYNQHSSHVSCQQQVHIAAYLCQQEQGSAGVH